MNTEYESLRKEIIAWQERRFTILAGSVALVTGILGLKVIGESKPFENWAWASALLLVILASACALTWYAGRASAKIAAYLIVFHESQPDPLGAWETRLQVLKDSRRDCWNLNRLIILVYLGLALLAVLAPLLSHREYHLVPLDYVTLVVAGGLFALAMVLLVLKSPKEHYKKLWEDLGKKEE